MKNIEEAIESYQKLGLKLHFNIDNKAANIIQAGFFLRAGGLIELIGPRDPTDETDDFVKFMKTRGEGFQHLSLDASAGAVDVLTKAGVKTNITDPEHADIDPEATLVGKQILQLNPVGMGTDEQVSFTAKAKL